MNTSAGILAFIIALFLQFIPLLAVPFAFRMAGATLSKFHEVVTNGHRSFQKSGFLQNRRENAQKQWAGQKATSNASYMNRRLERAGGLEGIANRRTAFGRNRGARLVTNANRASQQVTMLGSEALKDPRLAPVANDDMALRAAMSGGSRGDAVNQLMRQGYSRADATRGAAAWDATGLGWSQAAKATALTAAVEDGVVFNDHEENGVFKTGMQQQEEAIARIAGTDDGLAARLTGMAYAGNKKVGRYEMSDGFGSMYDRVQRIARGENIGADEFNSAISEAMRGASSGQLSAMKGAGMNSGTRALAENLRFNESIVNGTASATEMQTAAILSKNATRDASGRVTRIDAGATVEAARQNMVHAAEKIDNLKGYSVYMPEVHVSTINQNAAVPSADAIRVVHDDTGFRASPTPPIRTPAGSRTQAAAGATIPRDAGTVSVEQRQQIRGDIDPATGRPRGAP